MAVQHFERLTTAEAAQLLGCEQQEALALLKAAGIQYVRMGRFGAHLWCGASVRNLVQALRTSKKEVRK